MRYRSTYRSRRDRQSSGGASSFLMPFLIIICVGVIGVLLFNLWQALYGEDDTTEAYMHIVEGSAKMKAWGTDSFVNLSTDANIMTGDEIVSSGDGKLIIEFFDGTIMRMDKDTDVVFEDINDQGEGPELKILLLDGKIWFNKRYRETKDTKVLVATDNMRVKADNVSIFEVENNIDEVARVIHGADIVVSILNEEEKEVDFENLGVGQEIELTEEVLDKYWKYLSPNVIEAISGDFEKSAWYIWNIAEDKSPTKFKKSADGDVEPEFVEANPTVMTTTTTTSDEEDSEDEESDDEEEGEDQEADDEEEDEDDEEEEPTATGDLAKPTIASVDGVTQTNDNGFYVTTSFRGVITGGVSGADKVEVNGYTLTKFKPGDSTWTYLANANHGLMTAGENTFNVVAIDAEGNRSETLVVKVYYDPPQAEPTPEPEPEPEPESEESTTTTTTEETTENPEDSSPPTDQPPSDSESSPEGGGTAVL